MLDFLADHISVHMMRGAMAYYCLTDDHEQLHSLDGWLVDVLSRAMNFRTRLLNARGLAIAPLSKRQILQGDWYNFSALQQETRCPSFFLAWRAARKKWERHGIRGIRIPRDAYSYGS